MNAMGLKPIKLNGTQAAVLVILRIVIGWHFLYEGIAKMLIPGWTSAGYLESAGGFLSGFFRWIAATPAALQAADLLNIWGLTLIGACLLVGFFSRFAAVLGIVLLALYYLAHPPFIGAHFGAPAEGHYLGVNKNLVEMIALLAVAIFPTGSFFGLDRLLKLRRMNGTSPEDAAPESPAPDDLLPQSLGRRELLKSFATLPVIGVFAYGTKKRYDWEKVNAITGATVQLNRESLKDLKGELPRGKIGDLEVSRIILGGNLIGGWSHSRDLIYVSSLFKAYNSEAKVFETLMIAEEAGINTMNITHTQFPLINKYKKIFGSRLQTVCQIHPTREDMFSHVDKVIDAGVDLIQIQGNCCDWRVRDGEVDVLARCVDYIHEKGYIAGMGAHSVQALIECEKAGIRPDFYMKTLHHDQYWSAHPRENRIPFSVDGEKSPDHNQFHDNMFCLFPEQTAAYMKDKEAPFIAFKVLAGGAIHPKEGFKFAFENGADFLCVGMFDFQVVQDVNIALEVLDQMPTRERRWYA